MCAKAVTTADRREALRGALIDAAERHIATEGLAALRARDLAADVGCALGAIYLVFPDLGALASAVRERTLARLEAGAAAAAAPPDARSRQRAGGGRSPRCRRWLRFTCASPETTATSGKPYSITAPLRARRTAARSPRFSLPSNRNCASLRRIQRMSSGGFMPTRCSPRCTALSRWASMRSGGDCRNRSSPGRWKRSSPPRLRAFRGKPSPSARAPLGAGGELAYLSNDVVNRANIHTGLQTAAAASGGAFVFAFLLRQGFSLDQALALIAAIMAGRFCLRPMLVPLGVRFGIKPLLMTGTLVGAVLYPILSLIHGVSPLVIGCAFVAALSDVFYWTSYHAYFASIGDAEHRGHQIGAREALGAALCVIAPILGAWSLVKFGPMWTFVAVGLLQASAALPLINAPNVLVARQAKLPPASVRLGVVLYLTHGWFDACSVFVWSLALFVSLGEDYARYGGALALAGFGAVVGALWLGRHVDKGGGARAASLAFGVAGAVTLLKSVSLSSPLLAVAANAAGGMVMPLLMPSMAGAVYNLAQKLVVPVALSRRRRRRVGRRLRRRLPGLGGSGGCGRAAWLRHPARRAAAGDWPRRLARLFRAIERRGRDVRGSSAVSGFEIQASKSTDVLNCDRHDSRASRSP